MNGRVAHMVSLAIFVLATMQLFFVPESVNAINRGPQRYELQIGAGVDNFMGDICSPRNSSLPVWVLPQTTGFVANLGFKYYLGRRDECDRLKVGTQSIGFSFFAGHLGAEEVMENTKKFYYRNGIGFSSVFAELSLRYEWYFIKEQPNHFAYKSVGRPIMKRATLMPSYLFVGAGGLFSVGNFFWDSNEGHQSVGFANVAPVLMGGIGTKLRINRNVSFGLEAGWRLAIDDDIDNCNGKDERTPEKPWIFGEWYDQYQFITLSVTFKLREKKNHLPDFKSIGR